MPDWPPLTAPAPEFEPPEPLALPAVAASEPPPPACPPVLALPPKPARPAVAELPGDSLLPQPTERHAMLASVRYDKRFFISGHLSRH